MICERTAGARRALGGALAVLLLLAATAPVAAGSPAKVPGYVDGDRFLEIAGEDNLQVEVSISRSLLKAAIRGFDADIQELLGGIESIHAIILDLDGVERVDDLRALIRSTGKRLQNEGWERLARVREDDTEVTVLVLNDDVYIQGLVVMVVDRDENQLVFANIAGQLDLAAIESLQQAFDVPGLGGIDLSDPDDHGR